MTEKKMVYPDEKNVEEIFNEIDQLIYSKNARVIDALTALITLIIIRSMDVGLSKATILGQISNMWEMNDPENED